MQPAQNHIEQGGLARAVPSHQADAAASRQVGGGAGQDFPSRDPDRDVVNRQHSRGPYNGACAARKPIA